VGFRACTHFEADPIRRQRDTHWQKSAEASALSATDRDPWSHGSVVFYWRAQLACRAVRALRASFAETENATMQLDHCFQHRRTAAPLAFDCHVPPPIVLQHSDIKQRIERIKNDN
jgi:hypothetical protein